MKPIALFFFFILLSVNSLPGQETIKITQKATGITIDINFIGVERGVVKFTKRGSTIEHSVPASALTPDSIERLKAALANQPTTPSSPSTSNLEKTKKLNEVIGHKLFGEVASIWQEDAEEVAKRLEWELESRKKHSSSYRKYTKLDYTFLGAHPYCATLYGKGGDRNSPERLSLVYANKGDFGSRLGVGPDHFKIMHPDAEPPVDLEEAIKFDALVVEQKLTQGLGEPQQQYYGEKEDKRKVKRWDYGDHAFLLSSLDGEYVSLLVVPSADADAQGRVKFVRDRVLKQILIENVTRGENGDVYIDNIPMVDQGPKGYCAPATFERAMRYMRIPADMYLLATAATKAGGGTSASSQN